MKAIRGWSAFPPELRGSSLAIGNFDGVHRGHQAVLKAALDWARARGRPAGAMAFEPHPRRFFQPSRPLFRLSTLERKLELLRCVGLDFTAILDFDAALASLTAAEFTRIVLVEGLGVAHVVTGSDFHFGKGRDGDPGALAGFGRFYGFEVTAVGPVGGAGEIYSSTRIRELLAEGEPRAASEMLGYWWRVDGEVSHGAGRGAGLGFPTANVELEEGQALKHGIYAVRAYLDGWRVDGAAYLGTRPTFDSGRPTLEVFLFDFAGDLYGRRITVEFIDFLREDAKFRSPEDLSRQMAEDCARAAAILAAAPASPF